MDVLGTLLKLWNDSGFNSFFVGEGWKYLVMIVVACVLLYLGIVKQFEPLLLVGIAFGALLTNLPGNGLYTPELWDRFLTGEIDSAPSCTTAACWTSSTSASRPACTRR